MPDFALFFRIIGVKIGSFLVLNTNPNTISNPNCNGVFASFFMADDGCKFFPGRPGNNGVLTVIKRRSNGF